MKSKRNKTIDFSLEDGKEYLDYCFDLEKNKGKDIPINKTVLGDTFVALKGVLDNSIDLLIVDPPYNLEKNYNGYTFKKMKEDDYILYTQKWIDAVKTKLKKTASIYVCCDWKSSLVIGEILAKNFLLRNRITWEREKGRGAKDNWKNCIEDIFFATVSEDYTFNLDSVKVLKSVVAPYKKDGVAKDWTETENGKVRKTCPSNFWDDISIPYWSMPENTAHPTQKPEKLIAKLILASSNKGDLVLDPFSGSGTTGVVATKLERNFIDIEINPLYCAWASKRILDAKENKRIQGYENGVFYERNYRLKK